MTRITNSLFESIRQVTHPVLDEAKVEGKAEEGGRVDGAHYCATHVEHNLYGEGECISEQHAKPNEDGTIDWYNVKFADGQVRKIQTEAVKVKKAKMHEHATPEGDTIEEKQLHPNQQALDVHEPKKDKLTAKDFEMLRAGKKAKTVKKEKEIEEGMPGQMGRAGKVTMNQIAKSSASPTVKKAIRKAAPDIKTYSDRADALRAAGVPGAPGPRGTINASFEEGVSETIVKHNDFTIEITNNPTFGDFLRAVQSIVRTDEESMQKEIVAVAEQAFAENYEEVIIEAFTRMEIDDKMAAHRKAGNTVSADKYGTKNGQPYAEYVVTDQEGGRKKYIHHGTARRMESMSSVTVKK
jgi:hypothetical protein